MSEMFPLRNLHGGAKVSLCETVYDESTRSSVETCIYCSYFSYWEVFFF